MDICRKGGQGSYRTAKPRREVQQKGNNTAYDCYAMRVHFPTSFMCQQFKREWLQSEILRLYWINSKLKLCSEIDE
jgi:hypothetical protein